MSQPLSHVCFLELSSEFTGEVLSEAQNAAAGLVEIDGVISFQIGPSFTTNRNKNYNYMILVRMESTDVLKEWYENKVHQAFSKKYVQPYLKDKCIVDVTSKMHLSRPDVNVFAPGTIAHLVLIEIDSKAPADILAEASDKGGKSLLDIQGVLAAQYGPTIEGSEHSKNFTFGVVVFLDSRGALEKYGPSDPHQAFVKKYVKPYLGEIVGGDMDTQVHSKL